MKWSLALVSWLPCLSRTGHLHRVAWCFLVQQKESQDCTFKELGAQTSATRYNGQCQKKSNIPPQHTHCYCAYMNTKAFTTDGKRICCYILQKLPFNEGVAYSKLSNIQLGGSGGKSICDLRQAYLWHFTNSKSITSTLGAVTQRHHLNKKNRSNLLSCTLSHVTCFRGKFWWDRCLLPPEHVCTDC